MPSWARPACGWARAGQSPAVGCGSAQFPSSAAEHPEYHSKDRNGESWIRLGDRGESRWVTMSGTWGLAYPEVREYERAAFVAYAREFESDGVQTGALAGARRRRRGVAAWLRRAGHRRVQEAPRRAPQRGRCQRRGLGPPQGGVLQSVRPGTEDRTWTS